jgi:hypothetical protein
MKIGRTLREIKFPNVELSMHYVFIYFVLLNIESLYRACSSGGKSARLISVRSVVQLHSGPHLRRGFVILSPCYGAVAQLGERVVCNHEVVGSIPISSTMLSDAICCSHVL